MKNAKYEEEPKADELEVEDLEQVSGSRLPPPKPIYKLGPR